MIASEIRTTVMIAISAMLLASLLGFIAYLIGVRGDFAEVRNDEIYASQSVAFQKEINKFHETQFGVDVIATVREYYNSGVEIEVRNTSGSTIYHINKPSTPLADASDVKIVDLNALFPVTKEYDVDIGDTSRLRIEKILFTEK